MNAHLRKSGHREVVEELSKDLYNGVILHKLLESISGQKLPKILPVTKFRLQNIQNLNVCLEFIARSGVKLIGISAEEIADGNLKLILGMIWTIILRFEIQDISIEDLTAKEGLLYWCQKKTHGYKDVGELWGQIQQQQLFFFRPTTSLHFFPKTQMSGTSRGRGMMDLRSAH